MILVLFKWQETSMMPTTNAKNILDQAIFFGNIKESFVITNIFSIRNVLSLLMTHPTTHNETVMHTIYIVVKYFFKHGEAFSSTVSDDTWDATCINKKKMKREIDSVRESNQGEGGD